jgi:hypothetical protein
MHHADGFEASADTPHGYVRIDDQRAIRLRALMAILALGPRKSGLFYPT